jgi:LytR cell envelope-related transcriptional attenuator
MSGLLNDVGAVAGLASFLGLALLALLYFAQARDIRRLRENASFLVEGGSEDGETAPAEQPATAVAANEPERAAAAAAATAPNEAEAFRRAELARQAAERRKRFEARRRRPSNGRERPAWLSDWKSIAAIVLVGIIVLGGVAFGVSRLVGDDSASDAPTAGKSKGPCPPGQTRVAVLNGTPTPGLAATFAGPLKQRGYRTTPVGNTDSPFSTSVVMFDPQQEGQECARVISDIVGIPKQQAMDDEIRVASEGDPVAVVLGDDKAGASGTSTTGSGI